MRVSAYDNVASLLISLIILIGLAVAILFVVLKDFHDKNRYPWPHWVGVAVVLWTCLFITTLMIFGVFLRGW